MKIFIHLKNEVEAFDMSNYINSMINKRFSKIECVQFDSFSKMAVRIDEPDIIITWFFKVDLYSRAKNLKHIFTPAAGKDWVPQDPLGKVNVTFGAFHGSIMAESLLGSILNFSQRKHKLLESQKKQEWDRGLLSETRMLKDQTVLIIGYGSIGHSCAKLLTLLGTQVIGLRRNITTEWDELGVHCITADSLEQSLKSADHVVLILPSGESTDYYFKKEYFRLMKSSAYLYNMGRGNSIKTEDIIWALEREEVAGVALDVFEEEPLSKDSSLWNTKNLIITPHSVCINQNYKSEYFLELVRYLRDIL